MYPNRHLACSSFPSPIQIASSSRDSYEEVGFVFEIQRLTFGYRLIQTVVANLKEFLKNIAHEQKRNFLNSRKRNRGNAVDSK